MKKDIVNIFGTNFQSAEKAKCDVIYITMEMMPLGMQTFSAMIALTFLLKNNIADGISILLLFIINNILIDFKITLSIGSGISFQHY